MSLNRITIMGRMTRDPELRHTPQGTPVATFTLAVDRDYQSGGSEKQTDFIDCVAWGKQAEFVSQWFSKGMMAIVVGRIQSRKWQDQNGNNRTAIEINCEDVSFGETKKNRENSGGQTSDFIMSDESDPNDVPF